MKIGFDIEKLTQLVNSDRPANARINDAKYIELYRLFSMMSVTSCTAYCPTMMLIITLVVQFTLVKA